MDWTAFIHSDPAILSGKPVLRGTRLAVDHALELLAVGWSEDEIIENHPGVTEEHLKAVFAFSADCVRDEIVFELTPDSG